MSHQILNLPLYQVLERVFDLDGDRIMLKFHREGGQIFCKTVDFFMPRGAVSHIQSDQANTKVSSKVVLFKNIAAPHRGTTKIKYNALSDC